MYAWCIEWAKLVRCEYIVFHRQGHGYYFEMPLIHLPSKTEFLSSGVYESESLTRIGLLLDVFTLGGHLQVLFEIVDWKLFLAQDIVRSCKFCTDSTFALYIIILVTGGLLRIEKSELWYRKIATKSYVSLEKLQSLSWSSKCVITNTNFKMNLGSCYWIVHLCHTIEPFFINSYCLLE